MQQLCMLQETVKSLDTFSFNGISFIFVTIYVVDDMD